MFTICNRQPAYRIEHVLKLTIRQINCLLKEISIFDAESAREQLNLMRIAHHADAKEYSRIFKALDPIKLRNASPDEEDIIMSLDSAQTMGIEITKEE